MVPRGFQASGLELDFGELSPEILYKILDALGLGLIKRSSFGNVRASAGDPIKSLKSLRIDKPRYIASDPTMAVFWAAQCTTQMV